MVSHFQAREVKFSRSNFLWSWRGGLALALIVAGLFILRPGVYGLRNRIAGSIGSALGRRVVIDNVRVRILPRPGFDLEGLVIYDDVEFGAEPMIRAQEVSAAIRLRSLLRGRLEIATLSANEPSINLVRNDSGRWNLASLLERNAQIPAAPTGKLPSERRPTFPYLEAGNARINFKFGQIKKSYALIDADVALWQDSENSWSARIKAEPVRTDFNLTDTGTLQMDATWQRAAISRLTPVTASVRWQKGQLGQITKLLSGKDRGWRGGVAFAAKFSGTPESLRVESQTEVDDFHRYDIADNENVRLTTACTANYSIVVNSFRDVVCNSPVGSGAVRIQGSFTASSQVPAYDLTVELAKVPMASIVRWLRQAKKQVPGDLVATGTVSAEFHATRGAGGDEWTGAGAATNLRVANSGGASKNNEIAAAAIPLMLTSAPPTKKLSHATLLEVQHNEEPASPHLRIGPANLTIDGSPPLNASGWVSATGYRFFLRGDTSLKDLFRLNQLLALPVAHPAAEGSAKVDLGIAGQWQGFASPDTVGTAMLRNVHAEMHGFNTPVEIASASVTLTPDAVMFQKLSARTGDTRWTGELTVPRRCAAGAPPQGLSAALSPGCEIQFDLAGDQISTADLTEWLTPHATKRPWYRILTSQEPSISPLLAIRAHGKLHVARFALKRVAVAQVATQMDVDRGKITLLDLRGMLLQGTHRGNWTIDVTPHSASGHDSGNPLVHYEGSGILQGISLEQIGALMHSGWITGTADGRFEVEGVGAGFHDLAADSVGTLQFVMRNGSLEHVEISETGGPLPVHRFTGSLRLKKGDWELTGGRLESRDGIYQVSGSLSPARGLDFILRRGDEQSWTLRGPLDTPRVELNDRIDDNRAEAEAKTVKP